MLKPSNMTHNKSPTDFVRLAATIAEFSKELNVAVPSVALVFDTKGEMYTFIGALRWNHPFKFQLAVGVLPDEVFTVNGVNFIISTTEKS